MNRRLRTNPLGKSHPFFRVFVRSTWGFSFSPGRLLPRDSFSNGEALGVTELAQLVEAVQASPLLNLTEQDTKVRCFEGGWMGGGWGGMGFICVYFIYLYFFNNNNN